MLHQQLYKDDSNVETVNLQTFIENMIDKLRFSYGLDESQLKTKLWVINKELNVEIALSVGLMLNELLTNSLKYAYPSLKKGQPLEITISLMKNQFHYADNGKALNIDYDFNKDAGFGIQCIASFAQQIKSKYKFYVENGVHFDLIFFSEYVKFIFMLPIKKEHPKEKTQLHPRNKHRERYDFKQLMASCPALSKHVKLNDFNDESIDFFNPEAVKMLNKALLKHFYGIDNWDIPPHYLCPPIPGRADYIHYIADVLASSHHGKIPTGQSIKCLDIGVGANVVYPIIGHQEYSWSFIGADIDPIALASAYKIIESNPILKGHIELRLQPNPKDIFKGIIQKDERIDVSICNPPFHASLAEAQAGTMRKLNNLKPHKKTNQPVLNFGGQNNELWCEGGEERFVRNMIRQSQDFAKSCFWFSTLISKQTTLKSVYEALKNVAALEIKTIPMGQGKKLSRLVAWTFLSAEQQKTWRAERWI